MKNRILLIVALLFVAFGYSQYKVEKKGNYFYLYTPTDTISQLSKDIIGRNYNATNIDVFLKYVPSNEKRLTPYRGIPYTEIVDGDDQNFASLADLISWFETNTGGFNTSAGGSADGVVSNVTLSGSTLDFTGSNGGFNGDVDLSGLGGSATIFNQVYIEDYGAIADDLLDDGTAIQNAIDSNINGSTKFITSKTGGKFIIENQSLDISNTTDLTIKLHAEAELIVTGNFPLMRSIFSTTAGDKSIANLTVESFKIGSEFDANANGGTNGRLGAFGTNPALIWIGGIELDGFVFKDMEVTNPLNDGYAIKIHNESGTAFTKNVYIDNNYAHDLGGMFVEIFNDADKVTARYNNVNGTNNIVKNIGIFNDGMAWSLHGYGKNSTISGNYYEDVFIGVELIGTQDVIIENEKYGTGNDHALSFSRNNGTLENKNITIKNLKAPYPFISSSVIEYVYDSDFSDIKLNNTINFRHSKNVKIYDSKFSSDQYGVITFSGTDAINIQTLENIEFRNVVVEQLDDSSPFNPLFSFSGDHTTPDVVFVDSEFVMPSDKINETVGFTEPIYKNVIKNVAGSKTIINGYGGIESVVGGSNIIIDNTDPLNPVINSPDGGSSPIILSPAQLEGRYRLDGNRLGIDYNNTAFDPQQLLDLRNGTAKLYLSSNQSNNLYWQFYKNGAATAIDFATGLNVGGSPLTIYNDFPIIATASTLKLQGVGGVAVTNGLTVDGVRVPTKTVGTTAERPNTPTIGDEHLDTTLGYNVTWNGTNWVDEVSNITGWASYAGTNYTSVAPLSLAIDTDTQILNNATNVIDSQKPSDLVTMYDNTTNKIEGKNGDSYLITVDCKVKPTSGTTTRIDFWFDINGSIGELYRRTVGFPKGNGIEQSITFTTNVYTLDTWETNGAEVWCNANGTAELYDIRYVITRNHKAK